MGNRLKSGFVVILIFSVALLAMATAVQAMPVPTPAPCFNGVHDPGEGGVDCGGSCASAYAVDYCDGKDNDLDCLVDEDCNLSKSPVNQSPVSVPKREETIMPLPSPSSEKQAAQVESVTTVPSAAVGSANPSPQPALVSDPATGEGGIQSQSNPIVEGTAITTEGPAPGEETVVPVPEKEPEVQEAVELKESDVDPESFLGKLLRFFKLQREEAAVQAKVEPVKNEPNPDKLQPAVEAETVSESAPSAPSGEAAKAESSKPAEPEKKSFFSRLASIFR